MTDLSTVLLLALAFAGLIDIWIWRLARAKRFDELKREVMP